MSNNPYIRLEFDGEGEERGLTVKVSCTAGEAGYMLSELLSEMASDERLSDEEARDFLAKIVTAVTTEVTMERGVKWIDTYSEYMDRRIAELPYIHYADEGEGVIN